MADERGSVSASSPGGRPSLRLTLTGDVTASQVHRLGEAAHRLLGGQPCAELQLAHVSHCDDAGAQELVEFVAAVAQRSWSQCLTAVPAPLLRQLDELELFERCPRAYVADGPTGHHAHATDVVLSLVRAAAEEQADRAAGALRPDAVWSPVESGGRGTRTRADRRAVLRELELQLAGMRVEHAVELAGMVVTHAESRPASTEMAAAARHLFWTVDAQIAVAVRRPTEPTAWT